MEKAMFIGWLVISAFIAIGGLMVLKAYLRKETRKELMKELTQAIDKANAQSINRQITLFDRSLSTLEKHANKTFEQFWSKIKEEKGTDDKIMELTRKNNELLEQVAKYEADLLKEQDC